MSEVTIESKVDDPYGLAAFSSKITSKIVAANSQEGDADVNSNSKRSAFSKLSLVPSDSYWPSAISQKGGEKLPIKATTTTAAVGSNCESHRSVNNISMVCQNGGGVNAQLPAAPPAAQYSAMSYGQQRMAGGHMAPRVVPTKNGCLPPPQFSCQDSFYCLSPDCVVNQWCSGAADPIEKPPSTIDGTSPYQTMNYAAGRPCVSTALSMDGVCDIRRRSPGTIGDGKESHRFNASCVNGSDMPEAEALVKRLAFLHLQDDMRNGFGPETKGLSSGFVVDRKLYEKMPNVQNCIMQIPDAVNPAYEPALNIMDGRSVNINGPVGPKIPPSSGLTYQNNVASVYRQQQQPSPHFYDSRCGVSIPQPVYDAVMQPPVERYSRKVFIGGLPPDVDEDEIINRFSVFGPVIVDWPHKAESKSYFPPKGYAFLIFESETSVQRLVENCHEADDKLYMCVSSPTIREKPVQVRPWLLADTDYVVNSNLPLDPRKTIFVGGVPRPMKAAELALIMDRLFGGVCYAGIDTDPELKYPKGAGRVSFSKQQNYVSAVSSRFVQLPYADTEKRVEIKPYVLDDQMCDECHGARCAGKYATLFCPNVSCLQYYCEQCWVAIHCRACYDFHKPMVKEGTERPGRPQAVRRWM